MSRKKEVRLVSEYAREVLYEPLGIWGWTIKWVEEAPDTDDAYAEIIQTYGQHCATVKLCPDICDQKPEFIHGVLIHELLHLVESGVADVVHYILAEAGLAGSAYNVVAEAHRLEREKMVDHLSDRFKALIPINKKLMNEITKQGKKGKN